MYSVEESQCCLRRGTTSGSSAVSYAVVSLMPLLEIAVTEFLKPYCFVVVVDLFYLQKNISRYLGYANVGFELTDILTSHTSFKIEAKQKVVRLYLREI